MVDYGIVEGRRLRRSYGSEAEALEAMASARAARRRHGDSVMDLEAGEVARYLALRGKLEAVGASIEEAVRFYLKHGAGPRRERVRAEDLLALCLEAKWEENKRPRYLSQLKCSVMSFLREGHLGRWADEISREDVERWLRAHPEWKPKTRNVYLIDLRTVFAWGVTQGKVALNPCEGVAKVSLDDEEIASLSAKECERLLRACLSGWPDLMGYVVIGLFGGIRPEELQRLAWDAVSVDSERGRVEVIVSGRRAKTRRRRVVDLVGEALAWLEAADLPPAVIDRQRPSPICPPNFAKRWKACRQAAHLFAGWPHDALRHTYASMHYAAFEDEAKLQAQLGHTSAALLHQHYRALKSRGEATEWLGLRPDS